jgi:hypothetical protein
MGTVSETTIERVLGEIFEQSDVDDRDLRASQREAFVFHMTDWREDLRRLARLYDNPQAFNDQESKDIVTSMLYHGLGHLIAAARLYDYVPDPFGSAAGTLVAVEPGK